MHAEYPEHFLGQRIRPDEIAVGAIQKTRIKFAPHLIIIRHIIEAEKMFVRVAMEGAGSMRVMKQARSKVWMR